MSIRCFISINLSDAAKKMAGEMISSLRSTSADIRWVNADQVHLTLKFLGSIDESLVLKLKEKLLKKLSHYDLFYIKIAGAGCFPSEKHPKVFWIGLESSDILRGIQRDVDTVCSELGFHPEDRPFSPHVTIGRVRSLRGIPEVMKRLAEFSTAAFGSDEVKSIHIMKSELTPAGAEYFSLAEIPLGTGRNDV